VADLLQKLIAPFDVVLVLDALRVESVTHEDSTSMTTGILAWMLCRFRAILFLASDESSYINAEELVIDRGYTA
jgi:hypothetical protein